MGNLPWLLLTLLQTILLLPIALIPFTRARPALSCLFPSIFVATEMLRSRFPFGGFGWGRIAFSQADSPYSGLAAWGGVPSLTFFVSTIAVLIVLVFQSEWKFARLAFLFLIILLSVSLSSPASVKRDFSVLAVQGGVPALGLDFNARAREVFELHRIGTTKFFDTNPDAQPDLVLWPENAIDVDPLSDLQVRAQLQALIDEVQTPFIVGAVLQRGLNYENASILWRPKIGPQTIFVKRHLTPFGEYIPWRPLAEFVSPYAKRVVDFESGTKVVVHKIGLARIGPIICYELLDDSAGREVSAFSNLLVVQTNSATFGKSAQSAQQLGISRIRAIEHQRFVVSVSTSGISAVIDPNGEIMQRSQVRDLALLSAKVGLIDRISFSDRHGGVVEVLLIFLPLALALPLILKRKRSRSRKL